MTVIIQDILRLTKSPVCHEAADRIDELEEWIRQEGDQTDMCVEAILGEVCAGCRCEKLKPEQTQ